MTHIGPLLNLTTSEGQAESNIFRNEEFILMKMALLII